MDIREHYLPRFKRALVDEDWLTTEEVGLVLQANRPGYKEVPVKYVNNLLDRGTFPSAYKAGGRYLVQYHDVKNYVVRSTIGRHVSDNPTPNALRQRRYKERHGLRKQQDIEPVPSK
jgi:hypothetical protein